MNINSNHPISREAQLRELLERDIATGIPAARSGKINRSHYARLIGCSQSNLTRFVPVFTEYELKLRIITGPMRHFPAMRAWLQSEFDSGNINFTGGKIDRTAFAKRFKLRGGTFIVRENSIRQLFEEFDARAQLENYLPLERKNELDRLKTALAATPTLNKDRLTVNKIALAKRIEVPRTRFRDKAFSDAIVFKETEILEAAKLSKLEPYLHGRVFSFIALGENWTTRFLERLGGEFKTRFSGQLPGTTKQLYEQIYGALAFIGVSNNLHCQRVAKEAREQNRITETDDWEEALHAYRDLILSRVNAGTFKFTTADSEISQLRSGLAILSLSGIIPEMSAPLPGLRRAKFHRSHLRSVAEANSGSESTASNNYIEFAEARFREVCGTYDVIIDTEESARFLNSLSAAIGTATDLPKDAASAIRLLLERRLAAIRDAALDIITSATCAYEEGQEILSTSVINGEAFEKAYFGKPPKDRERGRIMRAQFPDSNTASAEEARQGLANFLGLIEQRYSGIPPISGCNEVGPRGQFFGKRYLAYGGLKTIGPMLIPSPDAVGATLTLYLLDSGANVSVGRTLDENCIEVSDLEGHNRITGKKARAQGKPILVDLPDNSPAVQAIDWLRSARGRLRACAGTDSDRLFLMRIGSRVQLMTPHWYTNWFKTFVATTIGLETLELTPNMIRPSVLLHAALSNDGRLATGMAIGQHGVQVSQGYQSKFPTALIYDENIRKFHSAFEILVMSSIEDAAIKLRITTDQFEARLGALRPTGLGTFCMDPRGRPGNKTGKCPTLDCGNDCPHLLIIAEVEAIAMLQIWQSSLRAHQPDWERERAERWDEVWLPWLCLTDVVEEKMARGPLIKIWNAASKLAAEKSSNPDFEPPHPW